MTLRVVGVYISRGKAYLPTQGQFDSGIFADIEPVYVSDLKISDLSSTIQRVLEGAHPKLREPTREEWQKRKDPILAITQARSWKELARRAVSYSIAWADNQIRLDMSRLDKKGRWENDPSRVRILPLDTSLEEIVSLILSDASSRPELLDDAIQ